MNCNPIFFPNVGFLEVNLTDQEVLPIWKEISDIQQKNFQDIEEANQYLIGNIEKEYKLTKSVDHISLILREPVKIFEDNFQFLKRQDCLTENRPLVINHCWVNFQKKYEFNPVHDHAGLLSFVLWLKIPFDIQEEKKLCPGNKSKSPLPGYFNFHYTDSVGRICHFDIAADKKMENTLLLFPAMLNHSVYPFYSSDDYRISVSGNLVFEV